jgi:two-component system chemotaxis sensor kinase CheA
VTADFNGNDTELDRNVIETIYDPLVHIVRNAVDHGLEPPEEREKQGKSAVGVIKVCAEHKGNGIEISVCDDGRGIDRQKVLKKAIAQGLVTEDRAADLSDKEIYSFLFLPGFSTAETVTEISGRGVGLDVVRKNIDQIHGKVDIMSELGRGTKFIIRIPLTLAIIDGFVTEVDKTKYVFPFNLIEEIIVPDQSTVSRLEDGRFLVFNRGTYIPVIFALNVFQHKDAMNRAEAQGLLDKLVIVITFEQKRYGIAVDAILGKQEIVIKSLNEALYRLKVFSGGTIFGDGSIGFIVDVEEFIEAARGEE